MRKRFLSQSSKHPGGRQQIGRARFTLLIRHATRPVFNNLPLNLWAAASAGKGLFPQVLLAAGVLRLARQFDKASELLNRHRATTPPEWQAAWANEEAAIAWHRGQAHEAAILWQKQSPSIPVLFNRGMAALFLGKPKDAGPALTEAVDQLSEKDGWHHLGRLYLALAGMV